MPGVARDTHDCDSASEKEVSRCLCRYVMVYVEVFWACLLWSWGVLCFESLEDEESVERCGGNSSR